MRWNGERLKGVVSDDCTAMCAQSKVVAIVGVGLQTEIEIHIESEREK